MQIGPSYLDSNAQLIHSIVLNTLNEEYEAAARLMLENSITLEILKQQTLKLTSYSYAQLADAILLQG